MGGLLEFIFNLRNGKFQFKSLNLILKRNMVKNNPNVLGVFSIVVWSFEHLDI